MALTATIFKAALQIADMDRNYYRDHAVTLARHPSETDERMMVRLLAFVRHANEALAFGRGLSTEDEPDLWQKDLTGAIELWIDVGLPDAKESRRACGRARQVVIYAYGGRGAALWWAQSRETLERSDNLTVMNVPQEASRALAGLARRSMQFQCTLQEGHIWIGDGTSAVEIGLETWKAASVPAVR
ncbi:MAG TPA: YaeQ family protein [Burkholderiales bacterium]|nr:YaeQ family protein [Burkholderiales bacterium]